MHGWCALTFREVIRICRKRTQSSVPLDWKQRSLILARHKDDKRILNHAIGSNENEIMTNLLIHCFPAKCVDRILLLKLSY